jgi:tRNA/rRNA methyltransferase
LSSGPAIILVRPQLGENIGMVARAMWNFGLDDLRLVAPRDGWPNPAAGPPAAGADSVLDKAQVFGDVPSALAGCNLVFATTIRLRGQNKEIVTPRQMVFEGRAMIASGGAFGILFGPERSGLETADVALAHKILTVPVNEAFGSLNLSQAVILCAYEWFQEATEIPPTRIDGAYSGPADHADLEGLITHVLTELEPSGYFFPEHRDAALREKVRNILTRPGFSAQEVRTLRGVIKALVDRRLRSQ